MAWKESDTYGESFGGGDWRDKLRRFVSYSFPIGTYLDINVRVSIWFILMPLWLFALGIRSGTLADAVQFMLLTYALLFVSVLLHEFGHCLGCRKVGGFANEILMWPLGGLAFTSPPKTVWANFITVAAGPFVTLVLATVPYVVLTVMPGESPVSLNPLNSRIWSAYWAGGPLVRILADLYAINYFLLLLNMLLVFYPFDGGQLVQIAVWKFTNYRKSMIWAVRIGMIGAVVVGIAGIVMHFGLTIICVFGFIASYQRGQMLREEGAYEPWQESLDINPNASNQKSWWQKRKEAKAAKKAAAEADKKQKLEAEVDRILDKVHRVGLQSLSSREKKVLQQATDQGAARK